MSLKRLFNKASGAIVGASMIVLGGCVSSTHDFETTLRDYNEPFPSHVFDVSHLRRIAGEDHRLKVLPQGDWRRVGRISINPGGYGTGVLVGPNIVMTADHVTENDRGRTRRPSDMEFHAGYENGRSVASSRVVAIIAPETSVIGSSKNGIEKSFNDVAFLVLEDNLGDLFGYDRIAQSYTNRDPDTGRYLAAQIGNNKEHPRIITGDFQCSFTQASYDRNVLLNNCDVNKGDSGGPLYSWRYDNRSRAYIREIVGITSTRNKTGGTAYSVVGTQVPRIR